MGDYQLKRCSRCHHFLPATKRYFNRTKNKKSGFEYHCRGCRNHWTEDEFQNDVLRLALSERGYKLCRDCGEVKALSDFNAALHCLGDRRPECKECSKKALREYNERPEVQEKGRQYRRREDVRARARAYESTPEYKALKGKYDKSDERKAYKRLYRQRPEVKTRYRLYYQRLDRREKYNRIERERYRLDEKIRARARSNTQARRARLLSLPDTLTAEDWQRAIDYFGGRCAVCGRLPHGQLVLAADHWIPLSRGGATIPENIIPLCHSLRGASGSCNRNKWYKDPVVWLLEKFGEEKSKEIEMKIQTYIIWVKEGGA